MSSKRLYLLLSALLVCLTVIVVYAQDVSSPPVESATGPDELLQMEKQDKVTVRALRGWGQLSDKYMELAQKMRQEEKLDLLGANLEQIKLWGEQDDARLAPYREELIELMKYMERGDYLQWMPVAEGASVSAGALLRSGESRWVQAAEGSVTIPGALVETPLVQVKQSTFNPDETEPLQAALSTKIPRILVSPSEYFTSSTSIYAEWSNLSKSLNRLRHGTFITQVLPEMLNEAVKGSVIDESDFAEISNVGKFLDRVLFDSEFHEIIDGPVAIGFSPPENEALTESNVQMQIMNSLLLVVESSSADVAKLVSWISEALIVERTELANGITKLELFSHDIDYAETPDRKPTKAEATEKLTSFFVGEENGTLFIGITEDAVQKRVERTAQSLAALDTFQSAQKNLNIKAETTSFSFLNFASFKSVFQKSVPVSTLDEEERVAYDSILDFLSNVSYYAAAVSELSHDQTLGERIVQVNPNSLEDFGIVLTDDTSMYRPSDATIYYWFGGLSRKFFQGIIDIFPEEELQEINEELQNILAVSVEQVLQAWGPQFEVSLDVQDMLSSSVIPIPDLRISAQVRDYQVVHKIIKNAIAYLDQLFSEEEEMYQAEIEVHNDMMNVTWPALASRFHAHQVLTLSKDTLHFAVSSKEIASAEPTIQTSQTPKNLFQKFSFQIAHLPSLYRQYRSLITVTGGEGAGIFVNILNPLADWIETFSSIESNTVIEPTGVIREKTRLIRNFDSAATEKPVLK